MQWLRPSLLYREVDDTNPKVILGEQRVEETTFLAVMWTFVAISLIFLLSRLAVRIRSFRKLFADDYLVIASWLMSLASSIFWQIKAHIVFELYAVQTGRMPITKAFLDGYAGFLPHIITLNTLFYTSLWSVKLSFLIFFYRLDAGVIKAHRIWWWVVVAVCILSWIACIADIDYPCSIGDVQWVFENCTRRERVVFDSRTFFANMASDVLTDVLITSIPFVILWNVRIPTRKKIILIGVFGATILIILFSIIRVVLVKGTSQTFTQEASIDWLYFWSNLEMSVAIMVASVASFRQIFVSSRQQHELIRLGRQQRLECDSLSRRQFFSSFRMTRPSVKISTQNTANSGSSFQKWGWQWIANPGTETQISSHGPKIPCELQEDVENGSQTCIIPMDAIHIKSSVDVTRSYGQDCTQHRTPLDGEAEGIRDYM